MARILAIDDEEMILTSMVDMLSDLGHEVDCATTAESGVKKAKNRNYDIVFLDVELPDENGLSIMPDLFATLSKPEIIIVTGRGTPETAELAMKNGAWSFIEKPVVQKMLELPLMRVLEYRKAKNITPTACALYREDIVGNGPKMQACMDQVAYASKSGVDVLITGETGTGKELIARAIHKNSERAKRPFVVVDCANLPPNLIESELFGHEKGAFTGADRAKDGLIRNAHGGTLFLDEVGELPIRIQKSFLRVLQERRYRPIGDNEEHESEFRLIAATNKDINKMVENETFREDLFYRLNMFSIEMPPLREHREDIKALAMHYVGKICSQQKNEIKGLSNDFIDDILNYNWPGNVREFVNAMYRAIAVAFNDPVLYSKHLPPAIRAVLAKEAVGKKKDCVEKQNVVPSLKEGRERFEKQYIENILEMTKGNINETLQLSGLSRSQLYKLVKRYGIEYSDNMNLFAAM